MNQENKRVMLVEDTDLIRKSTMAFLRFQGYDVDAYEHGLDAHEKLVRLNEEGQKNHYNLILSDIDMPYMDGIEFAKAASKLVSETPIILMSGDTKNRDIPENVLELLVKPVSIGELRKTIERYVSN